MPDLKLLLSQLEKAKTEYAIADSKLTETEAELTELRNDLEVKYGTSDIKVLNERLSLAKDKLNDSIAEVSELLSGLPTFN